MTVSSREQVNSATMIATHEVVSNLIKAKSAMENLVHAMHDLTCLVTAHGRILWGNNQAASWLDTDNDSLHKRHIQEIFDEAEWGLFAAHLQSIVTRNKAMGDHQSQHLRQGQRRDVLWSVSLFQAISDRRGEVLLIVGRDITDALHERTSRARLEAELETAQIMQNAFFPPPQILTPNVEICSFYRPAEQCSGDWWGRFDLGQGLDLVCIGDVTGHGAASALVTAMTQALCQAFAKRHLRSEASIEKQVSPAVLIQEINEIVFNTFKGDIFMTFFAFVFDHQKAEARVSNAAHNFPLRLKADRSSGKFAESIIVQGNPIGFAADSVYNELIVPLVKGDRFVLYTDGLIECRNPAGKMYGSGGFRRSILKHESLPLKDFTEHLIGDALEFFDGEKLADDLTLATIEIKA